MKIFVVTFSYILLMNFLQSCRGNDDAERTYRLSNNRIFIESYDISIRPNLEPDFQFTGKVSIRIYAYCNTDYFTLNSKNLAIKDIKAYSDKLFHSVTYELIAEKEMLRIHISPFISASNYITFDINFAGKINDDFKGLFKIQYTEDGSKRWLLATQLEPTYARMVFPCFDEPEYRAQIRLEVEALTDQRVLSLTDSYRENIIDDRKVIGFHPTIRIPIYTVAIVFHKFIGASVDESGKTILYSRKHKPEHSFYFLSQYQLWFKKVEDYLEMPFSDHSVELTTIPDADEYLSNAGLMVYKESDVFHIEGIDVDQHKEKIAKTSIHKLTHFWFSIITTIKWWENTWFSESFGTFFQYLITSQIHPEWKMEEKFLLEVVQKALYEEENIRDTSLSSELNTPNEIQSRKFNSFINRKGAAIIGMLQHMVTAERFRKALQDTLSMAKRGNGIVEPRDLWGQFQSQINNDQEWPKDLKIHTIMNSWMSNNGYPLVKVANSSEGVVTIEQEEYRSPRSLINIPDQSWIIPITCTKQSSATFTNTKPTLWSYDKATTTTSIVLKENEWILCNLQQIGYYRVQYSEKNWVSLIQQLKSDPNKIHVRNRAQLIDDSFHLAIYKKLSFQVAFELGTYLENEDQMLPWLSMIKFASHLLEVYERTPVAESLKKYFEDRFQHPLKEIGFNKMDKEDYSVTTARPLILKLACSIGMQNCRQTAAQIYDENLDDLTKIPAHQKYVVYCNSLTTSDSTEKAWNRLWNMYEKSQIMSERELILKSLACVDDETLLKKYIQMTLKPDSFGLYKCEKDLILKSVGQSFKGVSVALDIIAEQINDGAQSEDITQTLITLASSTSSNIQSTEHLIKLEQVISKLGDNPNKTNDLYETLKRSYNQGLENSRYKNENSDEIKTAIHTVTGYMPEPVSSSTQPSKPTTENYSIKASTSYSTTTEISDHSSHDRTTTSRSRSVTEIPEPISHANNALPTKSYILLICGLAIKYTFIKLTF